MAQVYGEVVTKLALDAFAGLFGQADWRVNLGRRAVRLSSARADCKFEPAEGGYLLVDVDGNDPLGEAKSLSTHFAARNVRHRFEVYERDDLVAYLHHNWPRTDLDRQ
jgi:hypothetical protein